MHPELAAEQSYVDHAYACLEEIRRQVERAGDAGIGEIEALVLEAWANKRLRDVRGRRARPLLRPARPRRRPRAPLYVGRRWVHEEQTPIVVNWQAPAARAVLHGDRRRSAGRRAPPPLPERGPPAARPLRRAAGRLGRRRHPRRRRHPARGARAQPRRAHARHRRDDPGRPVPPDHARAARASSSSRAGPGTGKTAVGLHRASWLLYTYRRELERSGRPRRRAEPGVHGLHLARAADARRGARRAARDRRARRGRRGRRGATSRRSHGCKGDERLADVIAAAVRALPAAPVRASRRAARRGRAARVPGPGRGARRRGAAELGRPRRRPRPPADEARSRVLRAVHAAARRRRVPLLRRHRGARSARAAS